MLGLAPACQSYEPQPLDPQLHRARWHAPALDAQALRAELDALGRPDATLELDLADGLSLREGRAVALLRHGSARMGRARLAGARAQLEASGLRPDPNLSFNLIRIARDLSSPWVLAPALNLALPLGEVRGLQRSLAEDGVRAAELAARASEWAAAAALEIMHCASLVHDDLPAFDDADLRRGKPSVHKAYDEPLAVLTGDSLIISAFETIAKAGRTQPQAALELVLTLSKRSGMPFGICAGQGWESETEVNLSAYHLAKTGALFMAATEMGAIAGGQDPEPWVELGAHIGEAFQVADDLRDALMDSDALGKPAGQDDLHGRPNAVSELGVDGATRRLRNILAGAISSIPSCPGEANLALMVQATAERIIPEPARHLGKTPPVPGE